MFREVRDKFLGVREVVGVPGEDPVSVHVIYVEVDHVARNVFLPKGIGDFPNFFFRHVAVATLMVPERPLRRHRGSAGKLGVAPNHVPRFRAAENVVDEVAALGLEDRAFRVFFRQVEADAVGVVEKESPSVSVVHDQGKRGRGVQVVLVVGVAHWRVRVPEILPGAGLLQSAGPLAAGEETFAFFSFFVEPHRLSEPRCGILFGQI